MDTLNYLQFLDEQTGHILQLVHSCSEEQLNFQQENKWNIFQILEHILIVENNVSALLMKETELFSDANEKFGRDKINHLLIGKREVNIEAPERLHPRGEIDSIATFEKVFIEQRNLLKQNIESGKIIIDNRTHKHPFLGEMTIADWLHFLTAHTQRHIEQIKDILNSSKLKNYN